MRRLLVFVAVLLVCAGFVPPGAGAGPADRSPVGAPDIRIVNLDQLDKALAAHRGSGVLLNFWAIWCEPCVAELPELAEIAREFKDRGGVVLAISYDLMIPEVTRDGVMKQMRAFVAERKLDLPILIYDAPDYDGINRRFALPGPVPVTLAIDRKGTIVGRHEAKGGKERFTALMRRALGE